MIDYIQDSFHRFTDDMARIDKDIFADICRGENVTAFTRDRKLPLAALIWTLICRKGKSLALELRDFMAHFAPGTNISKPGYIKRRMLLNPAAILYLVQNHNRNFYADGAGLMLAGYLILAVDGSKVLLPSTRENIETFGTTGRKGEKPQAALGISCLYDVLSRMILDLSIHRAGFDERAAAREQISNVRDAIGDRPFIVTMDRGYPSMPLLLWMLEQGINFVVRLSSTTLKDEQLHMDGDDCDMEVVFTPQRIANHRGTPDGEAMARAGSIKLRFVRIHLKNGTEEVVVTNLPRDLFSTEEIGKLYFQRWGVETEFDVLKGYLQLENFTGTKPRMIEQDIYATAYVSNVAADIVLDANRELEAKEEARPKPRKHNVAVNRAFAIGALKNDLISILMVDDVAEKEVLFLRLYNDILKQVEPVRSGRSYMRRKGSAVSKYPVTHKRLY